MSQIEPIGVKKLKTTELEANPYNPRRLFDREPLATLERSIKRVGILVPLTVYFDPGRGKFVILDGQRRWICAQKLGQPEVPANIVAKPSLVQNIVTMFQIHKLREDWELMPTALTLELLMNELQEKSVKPLSELTGLDQSVVVRCKKLLSYSRSYQDLMLNSDPEKRVKADFFIELFAVTNDRVVQKMKWFRREAFVDQMLDRYRNKGLRSVTDFRLIKQYINNAAKANKVSTITKKLKEFSEDRNLPLEHLHLEDVALATTVKTILKSIERIEASIEAIDVERLYGQEELWTRLSELSRLIRKKLAAADRKEK